MKLKKSMVARIICGDELKNIAGQVLTYNSKNFHWLHKRLDLVGTTKELEKPFLKNQIKKLKRKSKLKFSMWTKTTSEKVKFGLNKKLGLEWNQNGLGKPLRKKIWSKNRKNSKSQSEIAGCEQKIISEKANICSNTVFSLCFKIRVKKFHAAIPLAFSLHFLFRRDQNHYSNLTSKIMKMCEQIIKKKTVPQYKSNSLNCKKPRCHQ